MLTEKQNYLKVLRGEQPDWVPMYSFGQMPGGKAVPSIMVEPPIISEFRMNGGGKDIWGVNYIPTYETGQALLPEPNNFILKDIRQWRDVIKAPDISHVDWEGMVRKHLDALKIDREQSCVAYNLHFGYFQYLMAFMGFTEGLCALMEEPEEVFAMLDYVSDFYKTVVEKTWHLYNPDICVLMDDTAAAGYPFLSVQQYHDLIVPHHKKQARFGIEAGIPITMHNCGKSECFIDEWINELHVTMWDPAQTMNDLAGIKKKYGNKLVICGGWDGSGKLLRPDTTREEIYASVQASMDLLAPGGGYVFCGGFLGPFDDPDVARKNKILGEAVEEIGHNFYK